MALFNESFLRERYKKEQRTKYFSATEAINESVRQLNSGKQFDIFLSHCSNDFEIVFGLKYTLEDLNYSVYVDWDDAKLKPQNITPQTAEILKSRMAQCKCLIYAFSESATHSKWMPWELGYFDGLKGKVAVLPISLNTKYVYAGSEYVGLYYHVQFAKTAKSNEDAIWIYDGDNYVRFDAWLNKNQMPFKHE